MTIMATHVAILSLDGTERYRLEEGDGHRLAAVSRPGLKWRRILATSPVVDGDFETQATLAGGTLDVTARIKGDTMAQAEARVQALIQEAFAEADFLVEVNKRGAIWTYRARRPDIDFAEQDAADLANRRQVLVLSFPVQPNPTVTGV